MVLLPTDSTRVKQLKEAKRWNERPLFEEERPLFGKERFEHAEIQHRGIELHLAEVGVHGCGERRRGAKPEAKIDSEPAPAPAASVVDPSWRAIA